MDNKKFSCLDAEILLMGMIDGELNTQQEADLKAHIEQCPRCRASYQAYTKLKKDTGAMKFKKLPEMYWDDYWTHVYNRIERGLSWILLSLGAIIFLGYGSYVVMHQFYLDPQIPLIIKIGAAVFTTGALILLVSVVREKWMVRKVDKYRSVER